MRPLMRGSRGSATIEASVVFPVFLSVFFLLLFIVKLTCTSMILDYAVNEAAKEIAAASYPMSFLNELEEDKLQQYGAFEVSGAAEELQEDFNDLAGENNDNSIVAIISGNVGSLNVEKLFKSMLEDYKKGVFGFLSDKITPAYWDLKKAAKQKILETVLKEHIGNALIDPKSLRIRIAELPQSETEYNARSSSGIYETYGLTPGVDFGKDDVVVQLEYNFNIGLPFVKKLNIKMVHTAVEKAWLRGSFGVITKKDEGIDLAFDSTVVYITRTGIRYHIGSCRYLHSSKIPTEINEAKEKGYTPCKVCKPPN